MAKRKKKVKKSAKKTPAKEPASKPKPEPEPPKITPHPTAEKKVLEFENQLDAALEAAPEKRGRGRPRKQPEPAEPKPQEIGLDIVRPVVKMPFDLWATSQNVERLKITDQEAAQIAEPLKVLLDHYLPQIPTIAYAWISLAVVSYTIMQPRLEIIKRIKQTEAVSPSATGSQDGKKPAMDARPLRSAVITNHPLQTFPTKIKTEKL